MQSFHSCRKVFLSLHCRVHHFAAKQSVRSLPAHSPFRHRSQWYLRVMENLSRGRWTGFSHQLLFYISMLRSSFAKRHNFWSKPLRQKKNRVKILKLNVKGEYKWIIIHLGLQKPKWNLKTRETWAEKKIARSSGKELKSGRITSTLEGFCCRFKVVISFQSQYIFTPSTDMTFYST